MNNAKFGTERTFRTVLCVGKEQNSKNSLFDKISVVAVKQPIFSNFQVQNICIPFGRDHRPKQTFKPKKRGRLEHSPSFPIGGRAERMVQENKDILDTWIKLKKDGDSPAILQALAGFSVLRAVTS